MLKIKVKENKDILDVKLKYCCTSAFELLLIINLLKDCLHNDYNMTDEEIYKNLEDFKKGGDQFGVHQKR